jgi:ankyrin repeat protein
MPRMILLFAGAVSMAACGQTPTLGTVSGDGMPRLSGAARSGSVDAMHALLDAGADPNQRDTRVTGWPPLMHAIHKAQHAAIRLLLDRGADPNGAGPGGYSALMMATLDKDTTALTLLLAAGADPNQSRPPGYTPLMMAASHADPTMAKRLLAAGADPHREGPGGMTALTEAIAGGALSGLDGPSPGSCHPETVRILLERAPGLAIPQTSAGRTALMWAYLHAGVQRVSNISMVATTGRSPETSCSEVLDLVSGRN